MTKLKAQLLEEEKARRAIKRGAKPVGKLQHAATAPTSAPRADGASTSTAAASAQPSVESDALLAAQIDAALGTEGEGDLANVQGVGIIEDRLRQGQERGQTIQEVIRGLEDDVEVEGGDDGGACPACRLPRVGSPPCRLPPEGAGASTHQQMRGTAAALRRRRTSWVLTAVQVRWCGCGGAIRAGARARRCSRLSLTMTIRASSWTWTPLTRQVRKPARMRTRAGFA